MKLKLLIAIILIFFQHPILADIVTDGSVGPAGQPINAIGGEYTIGQKLGHLDSEGNNLFHSFVKFSLEDGEKATFTGENTIQNVISRVTGGNPSTIDGILKSEVGSADFYFINPAGVVFGENAQVDLPASFHVSTAGELIFADGSSFSALNPEASTLTSAAPEAFGFTSGQNGRLQVIGGQLKFKPGANVSLSANGLFIGGIKQDSGNIQRAQIKIRIDDSNPTNRESEQGIRVNLTAVDSTTQTIPITDLATTATGGELVIENSDVRVSGNGSGRLAIRAGTMSATNDSTLIATNTGDRKMSPGDGVNILVDSLRLDNSFLRSNTEKTGEAGTIFVAVNKTLEILNEGTIFSINKRGGKSSNITVTAGQLIIDDAQIASDAQVLTGNAGDVSIIVDESLQVLNGGKISSENISGKTFTSKNTETTETNSGAKSGNLTIQAELIKVLSGGRISASNLGGNAGNVTMKAGHLIIDGHSQREKKTGIFSLVSGRTTTSTAGTVTITVDNSIKVLNDGQINTTSVGGSGGDINITSGKWNQLQNNGQIIASVLDKQSEQKAGNIKIVAPVLILDTAKILADTKSEDATEGDVVINTTQLVASGNSFDTDPNIKPSPINVISAATSGELKITSPELNIVGTLAGVTTPSLEIERLSQDPCAHGRKNSLKSLGRGGAPAFQHGENYLPINRFDETEREPDDMGTLQTTSSINADHENIATECAKPRRTSLN